VRRERRLYVSTALAFAAILLTDYLLYVLFYPGSPPGLTLVLALLVALALVLFVSVWLVGGGEGGGG
jgi:hypothetical protein